MKNELGYEVVRHCSICDCGKRGDHDERHDAYFCSDCNKWLESGCDDPECSFCKDRPEKPTA